MFSCSGLSLENTLQSTFLGFFSNCFIFGLIWSLKYKNIGECFLPFPYVLCLLQSKSSGFVSIISIWICDGQAFSSPLSQKLKSPYLNFFGRDFFSPYLKMYLNVAARNKTKFQPTFVIYPRQTNKTKIDSNEVRLCNCPSPHISIAIKIPRAISLQQFFHSAMLGWTVDTE